MSLPIPNLALIHGATQLATNVAGRVGKATGFDEVLRGDNAAVSAAQQAAQAKQTFGVENTELVPQIDGLHAQISNRIRSLMQEAGMSVSGVLKISLDSQRRSSSLIRYPSQEGEKLPQLRAKLPR